MEEIINATLPYEETLDLKTVIGSRVLADNGFQVGRVQRIRIHPKTRKIEGIRVGIGLLRVPIYIDCSYVDKMTEDAVILTMEPAILLKGRKVITTDGEVVGKVKAVERKELTNVIRHLMIKPFLRRPFLVPINEIKSIGNSIILKSSYHVPTKHFWKSKP